MLLGEGGGGAEQAGLGMGDELDGDRRHQLLETALRHETLAETRLEEVVLQAQAEPAGDDNAGRTMQQKLDPKKITEDFVAAAKFLQHHASCNGTMGVTGFCFGGGMANTLAWRLPDLIKAAVPYYGGQPSAENAAKIKGALLLHYAGLDTRVNEGWPAYEAALKAAKVEYTAYIYPEVNHGFHNDTTPRYDKAAAELSWSRTLEFFHKKLA